MIIILIAAVFGTPVFAQTTIILQPNSVQGKDAYIDSRLNTTNWGNHEDFASVAWTNSGDASNGRGLIDFDFSSIPNGSTINSAYLSLYSYNSSSNQTHSIISGSNESVLSRINSSWGESTVTWSNQPSTTSVNQVILPASSASAIQDYLDINVTNLIQDMIDNPASSFGLQLKLATEQAYRRMVFASSDNPNSSLHPKLVVTYTENNSQTCFSLQPNSVQGKDAYIDSRLNTTNWGNHEDFASVAWTNSGDASNGRGLIDFDFSSIPNGSIINSAYLSLYSYNSSSNQTHSIISGSNESVLSRINSSWNESTVTWSNQPSTTSVNQVILAASSASAIQDYLDINITNLVQDIHDNPGSSFGLQLKLTTEQAYRRMVFASSDNSNPSLHPKLDVCYTNSLDLIEIPNKKLNFNLYPNPASNTVIVDLNLENTTVEVEILSPNGELIKSNIGFQNYISIDVSSYSKGVYFVKVRSNDQVSIKKLIID